MDAKPKNALESYERYLKENRTVSNVNDIYTSNVLKAADLNRRRKTLRIREVETKDYNDGPKLVLHFEETDKSFTLNKTNALMIASLFGDDFNRWEGKRITLRPDVTNYPAPNTPCIRVDTELPDDDEMPPARKSSIEPEEDAIPF